MRVSSAAFFFAVFGLAGCAARYSPALAVSPDGETVARLLPPGIGNAPPERLQLIDVRSAEVKTVHLPFGHSGEKLLWLDRRLYVYGLRGNQALVYDRGRWGDAPRCSTVDYPPFVGNYQGKPALFDPGEVTEIYSLENFARVGRLEYPARGLSDGCLVRYQWADMGRRVQTSFGRLVEGGRDAQGRLIFRQARISGMDLLGSDLQQFLHLDAPDDASIQGIFSDGDAAISPDHRLLMIAPRPFVRGGTASRGTIFSRFDDVFAVYGIPDGALQFSRSRSQGREAGSDRRSGKPVAPLMLMNDGVYAIEEVVPDRPHAPGGPTPPATRKDHEFWLTRYTREGRMRIVRLPLASTDGDGVDFSAAASPARGVVLIRAEQPAPRLIEVPLQADVRPGEIRVIPLRG